MGAQVWIFRFECKVCSMKTIQMTIEEDLLEEVDLLVNQLDITRSAFIRQALHESRQRQKIAEMERKHIEGYLRHPQQSEEFDLWDEVCEWGPDFEER
jgi:metal-responsive CopG/Arc/MetJ family transcriptional regulator